MIKRTELAAVAAYRNSIRQFGTTLELVQGETRTKLLGHIAAPKPEDVALVNALGISGRVISILDEPEVKPGDHLIDPAGDEYIVDSVHNVFVRDMLAGRKLYAVK